MAAQIYRFRTTWITDFALRLHLCSYFKNIKPSEPTIAHPDPPLLPPKLSPERITSPSCSSNPPIIEMLNNANNASQSGSSCSWRLISRGTSCSTERSGTPRKRSRCQQTSFKESPLSHNNASVQVTLNEVTPGQLTLVNSPKQTSLLKNRGVVVEGLIVRTEDEDDGESDRTRSVHLIPFVVPTPNRRPVVVNKIYVSFVHGEALLQFGYEKRFQNIY